MWILGLLTTLVWWSTIIGLWNFFIKPKPEFDSPKAYFVYVCVQIWLEILTIWDIFLGTLIFLFPWRLPYIFEEVGTMKEQVQNASNDEKHQMAKQIYWFKLYNVFQGLLDIVVFLTCGSFLLATIYRLPFLVRKASLLNGNEWTGFLLEEVYEFVFDIPFIVLSALLGLTGIQLARLFFFYVRTRGGLRAEGWTYHNCVKYYVVETLLALPFIALFIYHLVLCTLTCWRVVGHSRVLFDFAYRFFGMPFPDAMRELWEITQDDWAHIWNDYTTILKFAFLLALRPIRYPAVLHSLFSREGARLERFHEFWAADLGYQFSMLLALFTPWRWVTLWSVEDW